MDIASHIANSRDHSIQTKQAPAFAELGTAQLQIVVTTYIFTFYGA